MNISWTKVLDLQKKFSNILWEVLMEETLNNFKLMKSNN